MFLAELFQRLRVRFLGVNKLLPRRVRFTELAHGQLVDRPAKRAEKHDADDDKENHQLPRVLQLLAHPDDLVGDVVHGVGWVHGALVKMVGMADFNSSRTSTSDGDMLVA